MDKELSGELAHLIETSDGSARSRMMIASRALWLAVLGRKTTEDEETWKKSVSRYFDDCLRLGVALDLEIDGMKAPNPYKARLAKLGPVMAVLMDELDRVMLDPDASLEDMRGALERLIHDPAMTLAEDLIEKATRYDS